MRAIPALVTGGLLFLGAVNIARGDEESPPAEPPEVVDLPGVVIRAPRIHESPGGDPGTPSLSTPLRREAEAFELPFSVSLLSEGEIRVRRVPRSVPDALLRLPSVMVQKTGAGQSSPFLRGFTGFHTLFLIDGIRLNNSVFREGPNQYWSTVDPWSIERMEVVRGPHSVLYGSDAVGGTVNALPIRRDSFPSGVHVNGGVIVRAASAESAIAARAESVGNAGSVGWAIGITVKDYGDLESGAAHLPYTGYEEWDGDLRVDWRLRRDLVFTAGLQRVVQVDVPRTHTTVFAVPFAGTSVGTELERELDQRRTLAYARLAWDGGGALRRAALTVSWHRQEEEQDRLRTGARRDLQGFDGDSLGIQAQAEACTPVGRITWGADWYHDEVDSFRDDFVGGILTLTEIQGPVGDDATYDLVGLFVEDEFRLGCFDLVAGARFTYASAFAGRVDDPLVAGSDPATPGNVISVSDDWTNFVGSLRASVPLGRTWRAYAGVSQGFRAPNLSDLTAFDTTSVVEVPAPGLEPEEFLSFELGAKAESSRFSANAAAWCTLLEDSIVRSPTGVLIGGVPEVRKDNIGDGWIAGFEAEAAVRLASRWTAYGNLTFMRGEVDQFDASGVLVRAPATRLMPLTGLLGLRYESCDGGFWAEGEVSAADEQDLLSLRDRTDTQRIPPGGTPGWTVANLRAGWRLSRDARVTVALENLFDEDYRIHGSGVNEPGRNLVILFDARF
jgi:hemoglobin/transferrin/lactoferrin receptor protein